MSKTSQLAIGVDLGATKIAAALVSRQGQVLAEERLATTPEQDVDAILTNLATVIDKLLAQAPQPVAGIGIGTPGQVDPESGTVRNAVNLGWWGQVALAARLQERLPADLPIYLLKDANAEVLGEAYFGAGQGCKNLVYIGIGSGLGGGALVNGQLVVGDTFSASEIGHLSLDPAGRKCNCGLQGCAETVVSGPGMVAIAQDFLAQGRYSTTLPRSQALTPDTIVAAAQNGDPLAEAVLAQLARWLGTVLAAYVSILNPARIVIGGGVGRAAFDLLLPVLKIELQQRALALGHQQLQIVPSRLVSSAVGAACLVWHSLAEE